MLSHHNETHDQVEKADNADCNAAADEATPTVTDKADQVREQTGRAGAGTASPGHRSGRDPHGRGPEYGLTDLGAPR